MIGIDIASVDNDRVDWHLAREAGVSFAYFRADYSTAEDRTWGAEGGKAIAAGLVIGPYMMPDYRRGAPSAADQVAAFKRAIGHIGPGYLPPALDVEFANLAAMGRTKEQMLQLVLDYVRRLRTEFGIPPVVYTSKRVWDGEDVDCLDADGQKVDLSDVRDCPPWLARYPWASGQAPQVAAIEQHPAPPSPKVWPGGAWIHQAQGDAVGLSGFSSTADINHWQPLRLGAFGERVAWVQRRLGVKPDGSFGSDTEKALKAFQATNQVDTDGVVGPATFSHLAWAKA